MSYPNYDPPPDNGKPTTTITFVVPNEFPAMASTHMLAILKRSATDKVEKHFITNEVFVNIMRCFDITS